MIETLENYTNQKGETSNYYITVFTYSDILKIDGKPREYKNKWGDIFICYEGNFNHYGETVRIKYFHKIKEKGNKQYKSLGYIDGLEINNNGDEITVWENREEYKKYSDGSFPYNRDEGIYCNVKIIKTENEYPDIKFMVKEPIKNDDDLNESEEDFSDENENNNSKEYDKNKGERNEEKEEKEGREKNEDKEIQKEIKKLSGREKGDNEEGNYVEEIL